MRPHITALVVDDFKPFRKWVSSKLKEQPQFELIAEASDGPEAIRKALETRPDLVLLDIGLPRIDGIKVAERIRGVLPSARIVFVSSCMDPDVIGCALKNGAKGYVLKCDAEGEVLPAVEAAFCAGTFLSSGCYRVAHPITSG